MELLSGQIDYTDISEDDSFELKHVKSRLNNFIAQHNLEVRLRRDNPTLNDAWEQYEAIRQLTGNT